MLFQSFCVLIWSIALMSQAACTSFGGLLACRFILGMCEGAITPGFMIVTSMFYTRQEQTRRVGIWFLMNGVAIIAMGFISYGVVHTHTKNFMPWQW
jgi:ACS family allantoate permease-like MFS transporter